MMFETKITNLIFALIQDFHSLQNKFNDFCEKLIILHYSKRNGWGFSKMYDMSYIVIKLWT